MTVSPKSTADVQTPFDLAAEVGERGRNPRRNLVDACGGIAPAVDVAELLERRHVRSVSGPHIRLERLEFAWVDATSKDR